MAEYLLGRMTPSKSVHTSVHRRRNGLFRTIQIDIETFDIRQRGYLGRLCHLVVHVVGNQETSGLAKGSRDCWGIEITLGVLVCDCPALGCAQDMMVVKRLLMIFLSVWNEGGGGLTEPVDQTDTLWRMLHRRARRHVGWTIQYPPEVLRGLTYSSSCPSRRSRSGLERTR